MMNKILLLGLVSILVTRVVAQKSNPVAEIRDLNISSRPDALNIEITLDAMVVPSVTTATNPDRVVIDLPNTSATARQKRWNVNRDCVKAIRLALNSAHPPVARVVVDLEAPTPYGLTLRGKTIILSVLPGPNEAAHPAAPSVSSSLASRLLRGSALGSKRSSKPAVEASARSAHVNEVRTKFQVKYVAEGAAYLNGGRNAGLAPGLTLLVKEDDKSPGAVGSVSAPIADLRVISVAESSAVAEVSGAKRDLRPGDLAYLSSQDADRLAAERSLSAGDQSRMSSLLERTPSSSVAENEEPSATLSPPGRVHVRLGLDYSGIHSSGSTPGHSSERGLAIQADLTRIAGTHWNLQGYWRGRKTTNSQPNENTLDDYLNKTYLMQLYYDNPDSRWVAGVGRLYLPWAASLDTIDGGYAGRRITRSILLGAFAGSTPDPASWHYSPNRRIAGSFVNFEGGDYDSLHYTSTSGLALNTIHWQLDRPYAFFENGVSFGKSVSIYHSLIVDAPTGQSTDGIKPGAGISRSYLTLHVQPHTRVWFDFYHNYFRDVPTAATQLIATGLVDKLLYQGVNGSVHLEPIRHVVIYTTLGHSDRTGDLHRSLNQMYGITWSEIWRTGVRADAHYSKFDSSFARGNYRVLTLSRQITDRMLWQTQFGRQSLASAFTINARSMFIDSSFDTNLGKHTFLQSGYTIQHGSQLNYKQWYLGLGYRLDTKQPLGP